MTIKAPPCCVCEVCGPDDCLDYSCSVCLHGCPAATNCCQSCDRNPIECDHEAATSVLRWGMPR